MHGSQDRRDIAAGIENFQKRLADVFVIKHTPIQEAKVGPDQLRQIRVQPQSALLRMEKYPHQPARLILEDTTRREMDLAVRETKAIHHLRGRFLEGPGQKTGDLADPRY